MVNLSKVDLIWVPGLAYDCSYENDCYDSGCKEEGICRCTRIEDARVTKAPIAFDIVLHLTRNYKNELSEFKKIDLYGLERILNIHKCWNTDAYELRVCRGYYGEEIDGVYFDKPQLIQADLDEFLNLKTNRDKVEFLLNLEYGSLLDKVKNKRWVIRKVKKEDIHFGAVKHYEELNQQLVDKYENYPFFRGICIKDDDKYRLIDGYHRCESADTEYIQVIVGY